LQPVFGHRDILRFLHAILGPIPPRIDLNAHGACVEQPDWSRSRLNNSTFQSLNAMIKHHIWILFLGTLLLVGCDSAVKEKPANESSETDTTSSVEEQSSSVSDSVQTFVIDVRSQEEWDSGHLDDAIHIPHTEIVEGIAKVTDNKDAKICVY
jgi:phage shock protein E